MKSMGRERESMKESIEALLSISGYVSLFSPFQSYKKQRMKKQEGDSPLIEICWQESNCLTVESPSVLQTHIQPSKCRFKYTDTKTREEEQTFTLRSSFVTGLHCFRESFLLCRYRHDYADRLWQFIQLILFRSLVRDFLYTWHWNQKAHMCLVKCCSFFVESWFLVSSLQNYWKEEERDRQAREF